MRKRWSVGAAVAIAIGIAAALAQQSAAQQSAAMAVPPVGQSVQVTLAIESDGLSLRINHDAPAIKVSF